MHTQTRTHAHTHTYPCLQEGEVNFDDAEVDLDEAPAPKKASTVAAGDTAELRKQVCVCV